MTQDNGASPSGDRASQASPQAPAGLGHTVTIPSAGRSLLERAPRNLQINWGGVVTERWSIAIQCKIMTRDELQAVIEILTTLSDASEPAQADRNPEGEDPLDAYRRERESAVPKECAQGDHP